VVLHQQQKYHEVPSAPVPFLVVRFLVTVENAKHMIPKLLLDKRETTKRFQNEFCRAVSERSTRSREQAKFKLLFDDMQSHQIDYRLAHNKLLTANYSAIEKFSRVFPMPTTRETHLEKDVNKRAITDVHLPLINTKVLDKMVLSERKRDERRRAISLPVVNRECTP
jgi:hypothetical protein